MECSLCPDLCDSRSQIVMPNPAPKGGLLAVGEAPGKYEDEKGFGFVGNAGETLDFLLAEHGIPRESYGQANICRCRPPNNRKPTRKEAAVCLPFLVDFIRETRPRVLLLVGSTATAHILGAGTLSHHIEISNKPGGCSIDRKLCHPAMQPLVDEISLLAVPMPHTSGMAWRRKAPTGEQWCEIGRRQVSLAIELMRNKSITE